jgi:hypothetical protein
MKRELYTYTLPIVLIIMWVLFSFVGRNNIKFKEISRFDLMLKRQVSSRPNMPIDTVWVDSTNTYQLLFILIHDEHDYYLTKTNEAKAYRLKPRGDRSIWEVCVFNDSIAYLKENWSCTKRWVLIEGDEYRGLRSEIDYNWSQSIRWDTIPSKFSNHDTLKSLIGIHQVSDGNLFKVDDINKPGHYFVSGQDVLGSYNKKSLYNLVNEYFR